MNEKTTKSTVQFHIESESSRRAWAGWGHRKDKRDAIRMAGRLQSVHGGKFRVVKQTITIVNEVIHESKANK
jgi:hypothetical protein